MAARHESKRSNSGTESQPLDIAQQAFAWLVTGPHPVAVGGRLFAGMPDRPLPLDELRDRLLRRSCPVWQRDAVWAHLVLRSRLEGATWTVGCVGMALPALKATAAKLSASFAGDTSDVHAAVLEGFLAELTKINLRKSKIVLRLRWAAYRAGYACVREALDAPMPTGAGGFSSAAPPPPFGHPDLVLVRAVAEGVLSVDEAALIGSTRLERRTLTSVAAELGVRITALHNVRSRAERRLHAYLTDPNADGSNDRDIAAETVAAATISTAANTTRTSRSVTDAASGPSKKPRGSVWKTAPKSGVKGCGRTPSPSGNDSRSRRSAGPDATEEVRRCA